MKLFKRFMNGLSFDLAFVIALTTFCCSLSFAAFFFWHTFMDKGMPNIAFLGFVVLFLPCFLLFGLFYIFWSKSRLDSHEEVVCEELLEELEDIWINRN